MRWKENGGDDTDCRVVARETKNAVDYTYYACIGYTVVSPRFTSFDTRLVQTSASFNASIYMSWSDSAAGTSGRERLYIIQDSVAEDCIRSGDPTLLVIGMVLGALFVIFMTTPYHKHTFEVITRRVAKRCGCSTSPASLSEVTPNLSTAQFTQIDSR